MYKNTPIIKTTRTVWLIFVGLVTIAFARRNEISYDFDLEFNPHKSTISGREIVKLINHSQTSLDTVFLLAQANAFRSRESRDYQKYEDHLEAPAFIDIDSVTTDNSLLIVLNQHTINPAIILPTSLLPEDSIELTIRFTTKIPAGKINLCPTHSDKLYRLIHFYPRIAEFRQNRWQINQNIDPEKPNPDFANYSLRITLPKPFQLFGSLRADSIIPIDGDRLVYLFRPEYLQDIGFILNDNLSIPTVSYQDRNEINLISRLSGSDSYKNKIATEIIQDITNYYGQNFPSSIGHLTIFPTIVSGGFSTSNLILIDKVIFAGVTRFDYLSIYVLAQEIARQYLGQDLVTVESQPFSISNGLSALSANEYLSNRYQFLREKYQLPDSRLVPFTNKFINILTATLEKEIFFQQTDFSGNRANLIYIRDQTLNLKSQKLIVMMRYTLGDSLFRQVLVQYRNFILSNGPEPAEFFRIAEQKSGYQLVTLYQNYLQAENPTDIKIDKVIHSRSSQNEYQTNIVIKQTTPLSIPLEVSATDRHGNEYLKKDLLNSGTIDTLTFITPRLLNKISLDPRRQIWDSNRFNNQYPRSVVFKFLIALPSIDSYQIFYYPTFDFNKSDLARVGFKLRGRYWINLRPLFPAQSLDEWSLGINYGYKSRTFGYDLSYSTALLAFLLKPRVNLRMRDYFDLRESQISTEIYLGDIQYWGLSRIQGYQKVNLGLNYQNVRSLHFLNQSNWEIGPSLKPYLDYINFHNWGNFRHILRVQFAYGLPVDEHHFSFDKLTIDGQIKIQLNQRFWLYQRLFVGNAHGNLPKQEYFYFFGKNVLENQTFESYRLAKGEGDMRGYGDHSLKGKKILTSNTELRRNLAGVGAAMFDIILFLDSGILPESFANLAPEKPYFDAGLGLELEALETVRLGMHFPVWVSQPPTDEKPTALRWVIALDLTL